MITNVTTPGTGAQALTTELRDIFAQVTRYPLEIFTASANLEEDLGIDSVKLGEVFSVLRERYSLPEEMPIPRENLRTIEGISEALGAHLNLVPQAAPAAVAAIPAPAAARANVAHAGGNLQHEVQSVFASVTRYPLEVLELNASLEEDLGIDSVKLGEVFSVMRERYGLPEKMEVSREQARTIAGIADALSAYLTVSAPGSAAVPAEVLHASNRHSANGHSANGFHSAAPAVPARKSAEDLDLSVRQIFADVTRYPLEILEPTANLEEDLGIDSVKLGEVFSVLRERYALPEDAEIPRENLKTIAGVCEALRRHVGQPAAPVEVKPALEIKSVVNGNGNGAHAYVNGNGAGHTSAIVDQSFAGLTAQKKPFAGKVVLITGSGRALGKDIALYLAELGASVVVNSFHSRALGDETVAEIKAAKGDAIHAWGSVANPDHVKSIFELVDKTYGGLDFLICNASNGLLAPLEQIGVEHWEKAFRTNVVGLHQCAMRGLELMKKRGGGKIITMSSPAAHDYVDHFGCMGAVKAAVENLTKTMAVDFAKYNVQVNCVSPGPVYGDLLDSWPESARLQKEFEKATPYERMCEARDVSHFIAYLLSDPVKLFTGSVLVMDGGVSITWPGHRKAMVAAASA